MDDLSGDFSRMIFKRVMTGGLGEYSLDGQMIGVLVELDGSKNVGTIAEKTGISLEAMRRIIAKLLQLKIVLPVKKQVKVIEADFLEALEKELALAIGPIAEVVIEDAIADLGHSLDNFPADQAAELIDYISQEIQRDDRRNTFRQNMVNRIRQKGYL
ncbi:MAG: hypothetical protein HZB23_04835 [Deltaproteobacteria bacterium]|nr:hypothetical protein [Deltaproteobacteria bacterium]